MGLREEYDDHSFFDFNSSDNVEDLAHKRKIKRLLEDKLERKRLKDELTDDFDELSGDFDWSDLDR